MRARIGIALGLYWGGIVYLVDVIAAISALGLIGGLSALFGALARYSRLHSHSASASARHALCNKP
jgi:hypothetical protein